MLKVKKISLDLILNIFASFVPLFFLQFVIQPYIARIIGSERYGSQLLILGVINIGVSVFGSSLNNARLIDNRFYEKEKGDYPLLLIAFCVCSSAFTFFALKVYQIPLDWVSYSILIFSSIFAVSNCYLEADYRIKLKYKNILASKLSLTLGYGFGVIVFLYTNRWELIFFVGYGFEFIYILFSTNLWRESYSITKNINRTLKRVFFLVLSAALGSALIYLDRLIIFPVFGGTELSIYYAASLVGKTLMLITVPMAGVLLSYVARMNHFTKKQYSIYCLMLAGISILGYFVCIFISKPLIGLLYPDLLIASLPYIPYTVGASMFGVFYSFVWPLVLRFGKNSYPLIITVLKAVVYIFLAIILINSHGVLGVAYANLLASAVQAITVFILGLRISKSNFKGTQINAYN